jgi:hypothetical protein
MKRKKRIGDDWPERRERMLRNAEKLREFVAKGEAELKKKRERESG